MGETEACQTDAPGPLAFQTDAEDENLVPYRLSEETAKTVHLTRVTRQWGFFKEKEQELEPIRDEYYRKYELVLPGAYSPELRQGRSASINELIRYSCFSSYKTQLFFSLSVTVSCPAILFSVHKLLELTRRCRYLLLHIYFIIDLVLCNLGQYIVNVQ